MTKAPVTKAPVTKTRPRRVLGIDPGQKRTGLALSDPLGLSVRPLPNREPKSRAQDVAFLIELCREHEVEAVVIGLALMPQSAEEGPMAKRARGLANVLVQTLSEADPLLKQVRVFLVDERGTSVMAAERLAASGVKKSKRKAALDSEAARVLVETFLAGEHGEEVRARTLEEAQEEAQEEAGAAER